MNLLSLLRKDNKKIIEKIHHEFDIAGETLLKQSLSILHSAAKADKQKGERLKALGFENTPQAKEAEEILKSEDSARKTAELIQQYSIEYPNNKFITEKMVGEICKKYNLVCGDVSLYKGFVPEDKLRAMEDFVAKNKFDIWRCRGNGTTLDMSGWKVMLRDNYYHFFREHVSIPTYGDDYMFLSRNGVLFYGDNNGHKFKFKHDVHMLQKEGLKICAPIKEMNTEEMELKGHHLTRKHIPDPVVLQPVDGGYLIVTAWGEESSDPIVVNQKFN